MDLLPIFQNQMPPRQRSMGEPVVNIENSREWVAIKVCFDTPENMNKNESKYSPSFSCLERMWKLGVVNQQTDNGKYANHGIYLQLDSEESINVSIIFRIRKSNLDEKGQQLSNVNFEAGKRRVLQNLFNGMSCQIMLWIESLQLRFK